MAMGLIKIVTMFTIAVDIRPTSWPWQPFIGRLNSVLFSHWKFQNRTILVKFYIVNTHKELIFPADNLCMKTFFWGKIIFLSRGVIYHVNILCFTMFWLNTRFITRKMACELPSFTFLSQTFILAIQANRPHLNPYIHHLKWNQKDSNEVFVKSLCDLSSNIGD